MIINKEKQAVLATNAKNRNTMIKIGTPLLLKLTNKPYHIIQDVFYDLFIYLYSTNNQIMIFQHGLLVERL